MITFGTKRVGKGKKSRSPVKFPRNTKFMKDYDGYHISMARNHDWKECTIMSGNLRRFLLSNVGRPINKVYSEFIKRCNNSVLRPKYKFFKYIYRKENVPKYGGFYVTNGILNYRKKPITKKKDLLPYYYKYKEANFPKKEKIKALCESVYMNPVYVGKFYVNNPGHWVPWIEGVYIQKINSFDLDFEYINVYNIGSYIYIDQHGEVTFYYSLLYVPTEIQDKLFVFKVKRKKM